MGRLIKTREDGSCYEVVLSIDIYKRDDGMWNVDVYKGDSRLEHLCATFSTPKEAFEYEHRLIRRQYIADCILSLLERKWGRSDAVSCN